jgi:hypothetical protein
MAISTGRVDAAYMSTLAFMKDREAFKEILDTQREADFLDFMEIVGRAKASDQEEYEHTENDSVFASIIVESFTGVAPAPDTDSVVTLADASHYNSGKSSAPVVGEEVLLPNRMKALIVAKDSSVDNAHTITLRPNAGEDIVAALGAGMVLSLPNTAFADGLGSPEGRRFNILNFKNNVMITKDAFAITVGQKVTKQYFNHAGSPFFLAKGQHDTLLHFRLQEANALLTSQGSTYTDAQGNTVKTTRGLDKEIRTNGYDHAVIGTVFAKEDMRAIDKKLSRVNAPDDFWFLVGSTLNQDVDDLFFTLEGLKNGAIRYDSFGSANAKQRAVDLGFDSYRVYNRTFHKKRLKALNQQYVTAASDAFTYPSTGYMIPTDKVKDAKKGDSMDRICVRYREGDGTSLGYHEAWTGKFAPKGATNDISEARLHYERHSGLQVAGAKDMVVVNG